MIRTIGNVIRGEGFASAIRRARERVAEKFQPRFARDAEIVNVAASVAPRTGGVAAQLIARLRVEQEHRTVALRQTIPRDARAIHLEGTSGVPIDDVLRLITSGVKVIVSVHDFSLFSANPHSPDGQHEQRLLSHELLALATRVIFPSQFLLDKHRELFSLPDLGGEVIEPGAPAHVVSIDATRRGVAYAGSVKRHKGAQLLPELARLLGQRGIALHVFGGGDVDLLRALRRVPNVIIHGYYRSGELPSLLARHRIGLVVLPSIVPESFSLTLSEAWLAGASVAAFDLGAIAERIRREGGGWLAPLESGAAGLMSIIDRWLGGERVAHSSRTPASPRDAANAMLDLYRRLGLL